MTTLQINIALNKDQSEHDCHRDIELLPENTLSELAEAIVEAFGFDFDHAFGFYSDLEYRYFGSEEKYELFADMDEEDGIKQKDSQGNKPQSVLKTPVGNVFLKTGKEMQFIFDYGDEWRFLTKLTSFGESIPQKKYPAIIHSSGKAPLQYPDYDDMDEQVS